MAITVRDEFNGTSANIGDDARFPEVGDAWRKHPDFAALGRALRVTGNGTVTRSYTNADTAFYYVPTLPPDPDVQHIAFSVAIHSAVSGQFMQIVGRLDSSALGSHYRLAIGTTTMSIGRAATANGSTSTIAASVAHGIANDGVLVDGVWTIETVGAEVRHTVTVGSSTIINAAADASGSRLVPTGGGYIGIRSGGATGGASSGVHFGRLEMDAAGIIPAADRLVIVSTPDAVHAVGSVVSVDVEARIGMGATVDTGYAGTARLVWSDAPSVPLAQSAITAGVGTVSYELLPADIGEDRTLQVVDVAGALLTSAATSAFDVRVVGTRIVLDTTPGTVALDAPFTLAGRIADEDGNTATTAEGTLTIAASRGGIAGTLAVPVVAGAFSVTDLRLDTLGSVDVLLTFEELSGEAELTVTTPPTRTFLLIATARDASDNAIARAKTWLTSDPTVATVGPNGFVAAVSPGACVISVESGGQSATCDVTVVEG